MFAESSSARSLAPQSREAVQARPLSLAVSTWHSYTLTTWCVGLAVAEENRETKSRRTLRLAVGTSRSKLDPLSRRAPSTAPRRGHAWLLAAREHCTARSPDRPSAAPMAPRARLVFQVAPPPSTSPPLSASDRARAATPRPLPPPPAQVVTKGVFSILPTGGVRVGEREVRVPAGTPVERVDERAVGLVESAEGLRWAGMNEQGRSGQWTLWLLKCVPAFFSSSSLRTRPDAPPCSATEPDALAVQRVLLRLPPDIAPPRARLHARQAPPPPRLRNSILLYNHSTRSVLAVLPLSPSTAPDLPAAPPRPPKPHSHAHTAPSPTQHPSAADFAVYVNHVTAALHPSPTPETLRRDEWAARKEIERLAAEETADDELRLPPAPEMLELVALPELGVPVGSSTSTRSGTGREGDVQWRYEREGLDKGLERLDLETELARDVPLGTLSAAVSTSHSSRQASSWTVSSWATRGTERFVTADEGDDELENGPVSAFTARADDDETPRATRIVEHDQPRPLSALSPSPSFKTPIPSDLTHTLTNGNAVLLDFLGAPSLVLPTSSSSSSVSPPRRIAVTAHPLSAEQASEMEARGDIEPAVVQAPETSGVDGPREVSWWSWLVDLVGVGRPEECARGGASWLGWLALPSVLSPSPQPISRTETAASRLRRMPRSAGGETTARLSVFHFDEAGTARRAFIPRR